MEPTFNELVNRAMDLAVEARQTPTDAAEARDLSIAIHHLEDALTRYNSSRYRRRGVWRRNDPDRDDEGLEPISLEP